MTFRRMSQTETSRKIVHSKIYHANSTTRTARNIPDDAFTSEMYQANGVPRTQYAGASVKRRAKS